MIKLYLCLDLSSFLQILVEEIQGQRQVLSVVGGDEFLEVCGVTGQFPDFLGLVFNEFFFEVLGNLWRKW